MTDNYQTQIEHSSPLKSLILHLLPGVLIGLCYFLLLTPITRNGYPSISALMLSIVIVLIPFELGYLLYLGNRKKRGVSLRNIIVYGKRIPLWQYFVLVPSLFVVIGLIFTLLKPLDRFLMDSLFSWIPAMDSGLQGGFSKPVLIRTYLLVGVFGVVLGPLVEELYFRGYLLPRMNYAGKFSLVLHSFLFALYHIFTPWMIVTRTLGMLPLAYIVRRTNLLVGILVHILINSIDLIAGLIYIINT